MKRAVLTLSAALAASALSAAGAAGVTLTMDCGTGSGYQLCVDGTQIWAKRTGNTVKTIQTPNDSNAKLGYFQQALSSRSTNLDVLEMDVVWPGILGAQMIDLKKYIPASAVNVHFPAIVTNNTYDGKLVGMPWYTDAGVLYYRTDLLSKYGYKAPPKTWAELTDMAAKIQAGERAAKPTFSGYVFQGKNYEGLTCDALEWIASFGGGTIVDPSGKVTIDNPQAAAALKQAQGWVGTISPASVTTYDEEAARNSFQAGNAAFMRNWPYAYALGESEGSAVKGKIAVTTLPSEGSGKSAATLGGWQLGVSQYSLHPKEAADLVQYMTSAEEQKRRAIAGSFQPTIATLYKDPDIVKAVPFLPSLLPVFQNAVARPSTATKTKYAQVSAAFANTVYIVLSQKNTDPATSLKALNGQLARIKGRAW